jgi:lipoprotein-anchoring transpeptidase ErfK/SrfK
MAFVLKAPRTWTALAAAALLLLALLVVAATPGASEAGLGAAAREAAPQRQAEPDEALIPAPPPTEASGEAPPAAGPLTLLPITRWLKSGEFAWAEEAAPPGRVTIAVDLRARTLSVYRAGIEIGRSSIIYGADDKPTPTGTFPILEKDADHYSNLYDNAPMPWMLRLTMDGVAIHGSELADDVGTHGCVGLPAEFARLLFAQARVGDRVSISAGPPPGAPYTSYAALPAATAAD